MAVPNRYSCHKNKCRRYWQEGSGRCCREGGYNLKVQTNNGQVAPRLRCWSLGTTHSNKKMKTLGTAKFTDMTHRISVAVMLAALALVLSRFLHLFGTIPLGFILMARPCDCAYARKSVVNRVVHDRKNATFPICPDGDTAIREPRACMPGA